MIGSPEGTIEEPVSDEVVDADFHRADLVLRLVGVEGKEQSVS